MRTEPNPVRARFWQALFALGALVCGGAYYALAVVAVELFGG